MVLERPGRSEPEDWCTTVDGPDGDVRVIVRGCDYNGGFGPVNAWLDGWLRPVKHRHRLVDCDGKHDPSIRQTEELRASDLPIVPSMDVPLGATVRAYGITFTVTSAPRRFIGGSGSMAVAFTGTATEVPNDYLRPWVCKPGDTWAFQIREDLATCRVYPDGSYTPNHLG